MTLFTVGLETYYKIKKWDFLLKVDGKFRFIQLNDINDAILHFYNMEIFIIAKLKVNVMYPPHSYVY
jgi:hypothetical protein